MKILTHDRGWWDSDLSPIALVYSTESPRRLLAAAIVVERRVVFYEPDRDEGEGEGVAYGVIYTQKVSAEEALQTLRVDVGAKLDLNGRLDEPWSIRFEPGEPWIEKGGESLTKSERVLVYHAPHIDGAQIGALVRKSWEEGEEDRYAPVPIPESPRSLDDNDFERADPADPFMRYVVMRWPVTDRVLISEFVRALPRAVVTWSRSHAYFRVEAEAGLAHWRRFEEMAHSERRPGS